MCRNLRRLPLRFSGKTIDTPSPYILAEELDGELIEARIEDLFPRERTFNIKVETVSGNDGWFLGVAHQIIHEDKVGHIGFLMMKRHSKWWGYVNVGDAVTGYRFEVVSFEN